MSFTILKFGRYDEYLLKQDSTSLYVSVIGSSSVMFSSLNDLVEIDPHNVSMCIRNYIDDAIITDGTLEPILNIQDLNELKFLKYNHPEFFI